MIPFGPRFFFLHFNVKQHQQYLGLGRNWNFLLWVLFYQLYLNFLYLLQRIISMFFPELKDRFIAILHVHRFRLSGSSCNFLCFISMKPPSLLSCIYSCIYPHNFSLSFCYPTWYKYNKNLLYTLYSIWQAFMHFLITGDESQSNMAYIAFYGKFSEQRRYSCIG